MSLGELGEGNGDGENFTGSFDHGGGSGWVSNIARGTTDPGYWLYNLG